MGVPKQRAPASTSSASTHAESGTTALLRTVYQLLQRIEAKLEAVPEHPRTHGAGTSRRRGGGGSHGSNTRGPPHRHRSYPRSAVTSRATSCEPAYPRPRAADYERSVLELRRSFGLAEMDEGRADLVATPRSFGRGGGGASTTTSRKPSFLALSALDEDACSVSVYSPSVMPSSPGVVPTASSRPPPPALRYPSSPRRPAAAPVADAELLGPKVRATPVLRRPVSTRPASTTASTAETSEVARTIKIRPPSSAYGDLMLLLAENCRQSIVLRVATTRQQVRNLVTPKRKARPVLKHSSATRKRK